LLNDRIIRRSSKKKKSAVARSYEQRMKEPKIEELEKHFGKPFPSGVKALYNNREELEKADFGAIGKLPNGEEIIWDIAFYEPADLEQVIDAEAKEVFEFANDGCGNGYTIDPTLDDPPVMFYTHETGEWDKVADSFSQFMTMPRKSFS